MLALTPFVTRAGDKAPLQRLLVSAIEHPSVRAGGRFPPDARQRDSGRPRRAWSISKRSRRCSKGGRALVSIMLANNETGVIQPVRQAADIVHEAGGLMHVDAVQGRDACRSISRRLGADLMTFSAHKLGGPKGALAHSFARAGSILPNRSSGRRAGARGAAGTENVAGIAGFGAAAMRPCRRWIRTSLACGRMRDALEKGLKALAPLVVIFGADAQRLPNTTLFALPGIKAETAVIAFDLDGRRGFFGRGLFVRQSAALPMFWPLWVSSALPRKARSASASGPATTDSDIERFLNAWNKLSKSLLKERNGLAA
jgi:cysteine desulfurase